jgi:electron transfer flavoprotein alpha subunit
MTDKEAPKKPAGRAGRNLELPEHLKAYKGVWVFVEHDRGVVHQTSWELLRAGRKLADNLGAVLSGVLLGGPDEDLDAFAAEAFCFGADTCYVIRDPSLKGYRNERFTKGLTDLVNAHQPEIVLLGATTMGRDLAGSVATTLGTGLTADCTELRIDPASRALAATRPTFGGSLLRHHDFGVPPPDGDGAPARNVDAAAGRAPHRRDHWSKRTS